MNDYFLCVNCGHRGPCDLHGACECCGSYVLLNEHRLAVTYLEAPPVVENHEILKGINLLEGSVG